MQNSVADWTNWATELSGDRFAELQIRLTRFNAQRFEPALPDDSAAYELDYAHLVERAEIAFIEAQRNAIARLVGSVPTDADGFMRWYGDLKNSGPGQKRLSFPPANVPAVSPQRQPMLQAAAAIKDEAK